MIFGGVGTVADWAQVAIAIIGVAGLIYTLRLNIDALRATHKDFVASNPPKLRVSSVRLRKGSQPDKFLLEYRLINEGGGNAWVVEGGLFPTKHLEALYEEPELLTFNVVRPIRPGAIDGEIWEFKWPEGTNAFDFLSGKHTLYLKGIFYYEDANGIKRFVQLFRTLDVERLRFAPFPEGEFFAHDQMAY